MAATITFEQHVQQNNERLVSIRQALLDAGSFSSAAKELLEWVQDVRAFQKPFEENLLECLRAISQLANQEGYDLELGYRLLSICCQRRDRLAPGNAALLEQWNEELGQALLHRHPPTSQIMDPSLMHKNGVSPHQQQMMWSNPQGTPQPGSLSVVTTVYPGAVNGGYPQGNFDPAASYGQQTPNGKQVTGYPVQGQMHPNGTMAYANSASNPMGPNQQGLQYSQGYGVPRGNPGGPQYGPGPGRAAMNAAKVAAAAVATATATAVAYEHSSQQIQSHQYDGQQMPMSYTPNGSQVYGQPHPGQMVQTSVGHGGMVPGQVSQQMAGYPNGRLSRMPTHQVYPGSPHPSQMGQMTVSQMGMARAGQAPSGAPPQYPGYPTSRMRAAQAGMTMAQMGQAAGMVQYGPRTMQRMMRPGMYPPGAMIQNGQYVHSPAMMRQMSMPGQGYPAGPNGMIPGGMNGTMPPGYPGQQVRMMPTTPIDVKPNIAKMEEPRVTKLLPDGCLLPIFRLEHNAKVTEHKFTITEEVMQILMREEDSEIQLKCFHHDDKNHSNNWPHSNLNQPNAPNPMFQPSVEVAVNGNPIPITRVNQPLYVKRFCHSQQNTLQITVHQCCCSHFFVLQRVSRPTVDNIVRKLTHRCDNQRNFAKCLERIKRRFSQNPAAGEVEQTSEKVSIRCPLGRNIIEIPARGINCTHVTCFDLRNFLSFHQEKPHIWQCPICQQQVMQDDLEIDSYFIKVLEDVRNCESRAHVEDVIIYASGKWEQVLLTPSAIKQEPGGNSETCYPPAKRLKSEPGGMNPGTCPTNYWNEIQHPASVGPITGLVGSPQQLNSAVLSPYGPASALSPGSINPAQINQRSASTPGHGQAMGPSTPGHMGGPGTPGHAGRNVYGPPTPVTPSMQNPPSVGTIAGYQGGPRSVEPIAQTAIQQQTSADGSVGSVTGSAPYTPASVGSAGSQKGSGSGSEQHMQSGQLPSDQSGGADLDFLFGDAGSAESGALGLLSDNELLQYLDQTDFSSAGQDFGLCPPSSQQQFQPMSSVGNASSISSSDQQKLANQNFSTLPTTTQTSSSSASDADDILASFLD